MYADTRVRAAYEEGRCVGRLGPGSRAAHQPAAASRHRRFDGRSQPVELKGVGRYERYGQGSPVVILSNPQADPGWWAPPFISAFGGAGYETIPFVHTGDSYAPDAVVRDVAAFVEHLDTEPVRLLGWSQGAAIAQELALLRPDLVAGAALLAAYGRQNSIDRLLQDAWAALDAGGSELDPVRQVLLLLTSYPAQLLGDDASADRLIAGARTSAANRRPMRRDGDRWRSSRPIRSDRRSSLASACRAWSSGSVWTRTRSPRAHERSRGLFRVAGTSSWRMRAT
jgi:pimeloyl-ACP methyl ester carboxylesterase